MRLSSNERYLELVRDSLNSAILPELQTEAAKATFGLVQSVLAELQKREQRWAGLLDQRLVSGQALSEKLAAMLQELGDQTPAAANEADDHVVARHDALTQLLARQCDALISGRARLETAEQHAQVSALLREAAEWECHYYRAQVQPLSEADATEPLSDKNGRIDLQILQRFVRERHPQGDAVSITEMTVIPGGYGKQTSMFTLREADGRERELIARKNDRHPMVLRGMFCIENEFELVRAVSGTGYPAPKPLWLGLNVPDVDNAFYVMEKLPGRIPGSFLGGVGEKGVSEELLLDIATQLARLHAIPLETFSDFIHRYDDAQLLVAGEAGTVSSCYRRAVEAWGRYESEVAHLPSPYFHFLRDWLLRNIPADTRRPVLVHGDFNIHNLLVERERVSGVLDWECAQFGAPEQDLAYIQPHLSRLIDWDRFMARYAEAGGRAVNPATLSFYQAYSMMRLHVGMNHGLRNLQQGINRDIRYSVIELAFAPQLMEFGMASARP